MATYTEVKAGLDSIAQTIASSSAGWSKSKTQILNQRNQLAAIPAQYADILTAIDGFTPTGAAESFAQAEKAKLTADFQALKAEIEAGLDALGVSYT